MRGGQGSWQGVLDRALLFGCALWITLQSANTLVALATADDLAATAPLTAALLARGVLIGLCLYAARRGVTRRLVAAGLTAGAVAVVGAGSLAVLHVDLGRAAGLMVPTDAIQAVQIFAVGTAVRFRTALWTILATFPIHLALHLHDGITGDVVEQWLTPTSATLALAALVVYLRSGSVYAEQLDAWNREARREATAVASHDLAVAEARRVIHDDVISALRGISQAAPWDAVEAATATALQSLEATRDCATLDELVDSVQSIPWVQVDVDGPGWTVEPPVRVIEAFRGAATEALRNVARHSGTQRARVTPRMIGRAVVLEIADRGRGFDVGGRSGFGLPHSILARLEQVGGRGSVASAPGIGTTVTLSWAPPEPPPAEQVSPYASDQRWRGYLPVALAITANSSFLAWRHPGPHMTASLALAVLMAAALPIAAWRFAFRPPAAQASVLVAIGVSVVTWIGLHLAGNGALLDLRGWIVGFAASVTMLLAFDGRPRHVLIPVCAQIGVCLWFAAQDPTVGLLEPIGALTTPVVICGFSSLFGALLRRGTHLIRQGEATLAARIEEIAWQDAQDLARRVHLETLRADVAPFLAEVLRVGASALLDADVVLRASVLSARCRDELLLPRSLPDDVRRAVDAARAGGATVSFRVAGDARQDWPAALDTVLEVVLRKAQPAVVTVIAEGTPRIVVLPALGRSALVRVLKLVGGMVRVAGDEVRTVLELSSTASSAGVPSSDVPSSASSGSSASMDA